MRLGPLARRVMPALIALVMVVALVLGSASTTFAAPHASAAKAVAQHTALAQVDYCTVSVSVNSVYAFTINAVSQTVSWYCAEGYTTVDSHISWGDGATGYYRCWVNCFTGTHTFTHTYSKAGTYYGLALITHVTATPTASFTAHISVCVGPPTYC